MKKRIKNYFLNINYDLIWNSATDVFWLSVIAFLPIVLSLIYQWFKHDNLNKAVLEIIHPSEILAFCLSFLAPSIFFLKKMIGKEYKLPNKNFFFFSTFIMYVITIFFVIVIKNKIDLEVINTLNKYIEYALIFLLITIIYRIYSSYHQSKSTNFFEYKKNEESDFNSNFKKMINAK